MVCFQFFLCFTMNMHMNDHALMHRCYDAVRSVREVKHSHEHAFVCDMTLILFLMNIYVQVCMPCLGLKNSMFESVL